MANIKPSASMVIALVALILPFVCVNWSEAQKTIKNSFQQSISSGSNPQSVYGGYNEQSSINQQRTSNFVAPVNQQRRTQQQTYVSRQRTESVRQPVYQQQQEQYSSSSSSNYDQAEADAEPPSYGKSI